MTIKKSNKAVNTCCSTAHSNPSIPAPKVIGLVGGVASGKSTVARMFAAFGAVVIDADAIAREVIQTPEIRNELLRRWGKKFFNDDDGNPNRAKIADAVFADPDKLRQLTDLMHPMIQQRMRIQLDEALQKRRPTLIVIDAPLLMETEVARWCDSTVFVDSDVRRRVQRANKARGWTEAELMRREALQMSLEQKRRDADAVVDNNGTTEETDRQVETLFRQWTQPR